MRTGSLITFACVKCSRIHGPAGESTTLRVPDVDNPLCEDVSFELGLSCELKQHSPLDFNEPSRDAIISRLLAYDDQAFEVTKVETRNQSPHIIIHYDDTEGFNLTYVDRPRS